MEEEPIISGDSQTPVADAAPEPEQVSLNEHARFMLDRHGINPDLLPPELLRKIDRASQDNHLFEDTEALGGIPSLDKLMDALELDDDERKQMEAARDTTPQADLSKGMPDTLAKVREIIQHQGASRHLGV